MMKWFSLFGSCGSDDASDTIPSSLKKMIAEPPVLEKLENDFELCINQLEAQVDAESQRIANALLSRSRSRRRLSSRKSPRKQSFWSDDLYSEINRVIEWKALEPSTKQQIQSLKDELVSCKYLDALLLCSRKDNQHCEALQSFMVAIYSECGLAMPKDTKSVLRTFIVGVFDVLLSDEDRLPNLGCIFMKLAKEGFEFNFMCLLESLPTVQEENLKIFTEVSDFLIDMARLLCTVIGAEAKKNALDKIDFDQVSCDFFSGMSSHIEDRSIVSFIFEKSKFKKAHLVKRSFANFFNVFTICLDPEILGEHIDLMAIRHATIAAKIPGPCFRKVSNVLVQSALRNGASGKEESEIANLWISTMIVAFSNGGSLTSSLFFVNDA